MSAGGGVGGFALSTNGLMDNGLFAELITFDHCLQEA